MPTWASRHWDPLAVNAFIMVYIMVNLIATSRYLSRHWWCKPWSFKTLLALESLGSTTLGSPFGLRTHFWELLCWGTFAGFPMKAMVVQFYCRLQNTFPSLKPRDSKIISETHVVSCCQNDKVPFSSIFVVLQLSCVHPWIMDGGRGWTWPSIAKSWAAPWTVIVAEKTGLKWCVHLLVQMYIYNTCYACIYIYIMCSTHIYLCIYKYIYIYIYSI